LLGNDPLIEFSKHLIGDRFEADEMVYFLREFPVSRQEVKLTTPDELR
jgi:hypothetical protein